MQNQLTTNTASPTAGASGAELNRYRRAYGVTSSAVASRIGMDKSYLGKIEKGQRPVQNDLPERYFEAVRQIVRERSEETGIKVAA